MRLRYFGTLSIRTLWIRKIGSFCEEERGSCWNSWFSLPAGTIKIFWKPKNARMDPNSTWWTHFWLLPKIFENSKILQILGIKFESADDVIVWNGAISDGAKFFSHSLPPAHHWPISDHFQKYKTYSNLNTDRWLVSDFSHENQKIFSRFWCDWRETSHQKSAIVGYHDVDLFPWYLWPGLGSPSISLKT